MENQSVKRLKNPRENANLLSLLTFWYTGDLIKKGCRKQLEEDDLYEVTKNCESKRCGDILEKEYLNAKKKGEISVFKILFKIFGLRYFLWGCTQVIADVIKNIVKANAVSDLVSYFIPGQTKMTPFDAYYNVGLILFTIFFDKIYFYNYDLYMYIIGIEVRTALCSCLFRKILRMNPTASEAHLGNMVTLITKDVQQIRRSMFIFNDLWIFGIISSVAIYLLYSRIGVISLVSTGVFIGAIPLEAYIWVLLNKLRTQTSEKTDERLQITQEILSAIKIIKMYTWESFFFKKINLARKKEIAKLILVFYLRVILILLGTIISKVGFYLLIMAYIWSEQPTDASIVFFIQSHFETLKIFFAMVIPASGGKISEFLTAITRINKVLTADEVTPKTQREESTLNPFVELKNVTVKIDDIEILSNINFKTGSGITLITGKVGSGKSIFLKTILKEFSLTNGEIQTSGRISYASQNPWLFPSTIKQNILFGEKFDEKRYQEILRVCALQYDLSIFEKGDETIVTDNGQNLSKGQQARINLARAVYKDSEIYLLDDCLSALDVHVHTFIFNQCFKKFLNGKICIVVSQNKLKLENEDKVFVIHEGKLNDYYNARERSLREKHLLKQSLIDSNITISTPDNNFESLDTDALLETEQNNHKNIYEEKPKKGSVDKSVYVKYISFGGGFIILSILIIIMGLYQASESYSDKLISVWADQKQNVLNIKSNISLLNKTNSEFERELEIVQAQADFTFKMFTIMLAISALLELIRTYTFFEFCKRVSKNIHKAMVKTVMHAMMLFFDTHFIGNILNRLSQDIGNIDEILPFELSYCLSVIFQLGGAIILVVSVNAYFSLCALLFFVCMIGLIRLYLPVARNLQRIEASTRSPMIGHMNATLEGVTTIRAYKAEKMVIDEFEKHQNVFTSAHYTQLCFHYAFGFFMQMLGAVMISFVLITFILFETDTSAGSIGLALTQVISLGNLIQASVKSWADLENMMTATERALEYTDIKTESNTGILKKNWPSEGTISFDNVSLTYNTELILNNLKFDISSKEKIAVVGRTGAGKSSIISTIFRLYDVEGNIIIDGVDIKTVPLESLRTSLAIIPQDPVLFSGTIRSNLDPFSEHSDESLWKALKKVNLANFVQTLDTKVRSNAPNFSLGQKQMMCVARAILKKSKIIILDEATANMDPETENVIYNTIKQNFSECTVLTIAHRLQPILESDKVIVLDRGEMKEFDTPLKLLENKEGWFNKMIQESKKLK